MDLKTRSVDLLIILLFSEGEPMECCTVPTEPPDIPGTMIGLRLRLCSRSHYERVHTNSYVTGG